jgi:hypothetical protein
MPRVWFMCVSVLLLLTILIFKKVRNFHKSLYEFYTTRGYKMSQYLIHTIVNTKVTDLWVWRDIYAT